MDIGHWVPLIVLLNRNTESAQMAFYSTLNPKSYYMVFGLQSVHCLGASTLGTTLLSKNLQTSSRKLLVLSRESGNR